MQKKRKEGEEMIYFITFLGGMISGLCIAGIFQLTKEEEYHKNFDEAIKEAYLKGYEKGLKDSE